jgi:hypothetical protein
MWIRDTWLSWESSNYCRLLFGTAPAPIQIVFEVSLGSRTLRRMTLLIARSHDYAASSHSRCLLVSALTNEEEIDTHGPRMLTAELGPTGSQHAKSRLPRHRASFEAQSGTMYLHITVILRAETWIVRRETQRST